jgi:hypothetical protein
MYKVLPGTPFTAPELEATVAAAAGADVAGAAAAGAVVGVGAGAQDASIPKTRISAHRWYTILLAFILLSPAG